MSRGAGFLPSTVVNQDEKRQKFGGWKFMGRPRKNPHGDLHLVADGPMTSDFVSTQKRVNSIVELEKSVPFCCCYLLFLVSIYSKDCLIFDRLDEPCSKTGIMQMVCCIWWLTSGGNPSNKELVISGFAGIVPRILESVQRLTIYNQIALYKNLPAAIGSMLGGVLAFGPQRFNELRFFRWDWTASGRYRYVCWCDKWCWIQNSMKLQEFPWSLVGGLHP